MSWNASKPSRNGSRSRRRHEDSDGNSTLQLIGSPLVAVDGVNKLLLWFIDIAIATLIFVVPVAMGGRQAPGQLLVVILATILGIAWTTFQLRQPTAVWHKSGVGWIFLLAIGIVLTQLMRLPSGLAGVFTPDVANLLPLWSTYPDVISAQAPWQIASFAPAQTYDALIVLVAYTAIFFVVFQRIESTSEVNRILYGIAISSSVMAAFGLLQYFTSNGLFFWFYDDPFAETYSNVKGAYTNRNHFAHQLALGIGPLLFCTTLALRNSNQRPGSHTVQPLFQNPLQLLEFLLPMIGIALVGLGILISMSRGGAIAMFVALAVAVALMYRNSSLNGHLVLCLLAAASLSAIGLFVYGEQYGAESFERRMGDILSGDTERLDANNGRRAIWNASLSAAMDYPWLGTGIGSHREVYPKYLEETIQYDSSEFTHAESGYVQVTEEAGVTGISLVVLMFGYAVSWCVRGLRSTRVTRVRGIFIAAIAALVANLVHSVADFIWYVPALVITVGILAACAGRAYQLTLQDQGKIPTTRPPRLVWLALLVGTVVVGSWMIREKYRLMLAESNWHHYLRIALREVDDPRPEAEILRDKMQRLVAANIAYPYNERVHLRLAMGYLTVFDTLQNRSENPMSLAMIREAALSSGFESVSSQNEWLNRVVGPRRKYLDLALHHTRRALQLCPMQGHGYLCLSELAFLELFRTDVRDACIEQALIVRPFDPQVLFVAGREAITVGDFDKAVAFWQRSFERDLAFQQQVIRALAPTVSAQVLIETFNPDVIGLKMIIAEYRTLNMPNDLKYALTRSAAALVEKAESAEHGVSSLLMAAQRDFLEIGDDERAIECLQKVLDDDPYNYAAHYTYGVWMLDQEQYKGAADHIAFCSRERPDDQNLRVLAEKIRRKAMLQETESAVLESKLPVRF